MNKYTNALKQEVMNRARIYYLIYKELSAEVGEERAIEILKRAIYERGKEKGRQLAEKIGEPDTKKLATAFMEGKQEIDVFGHEVVEVGEDHALLRLNQCPLVEAWEGMGLSEEEKKKMCDFAYQVDFGKFEGAGYDLKFNCRIAAGNATCDLHVTPRSAS
jgi:predicted ArsR family transcriptional regulator